MQRRFPRIGLFALLLLSACVIPESPQTTPALEQGQIQSQEHSEQLRHDSEAPVITETGSVLPTERTRVSGTLEIGSRTAPVSLLLFTDHHCRYCRSFHVDLLPRLLADFVESGKLRITIALYPLQKYENSRTAAAAALCASEQGKGLVMHGRLFENGLKNAAGVTTIARELELNTEDFTSCIEDPATDLVLQQQRAWADSLGVQFVPTFLLNGEKTVGLPYYPDLRGMVEEALRGNP